MAPGRPLLDLSLQLANILLSLAPVALVFYLLARSGESPSAIGLDTTRPASDLGRGAVLAAVIGGLGLGLYLAAFHLGVNLNVVPENLPAVWWRIPVLILDGLQNGILEEIVVLAYLLRRLDQLDWSPAGAIALSAVLRGSYHLYQGLGGFLGNAAMGVVFAILYRRWGRVTPFIIAHALIYAVAFVGYAALHGHDSWLP
jgi:membrane protease YdiL (CAAX protease family)